MKAIKHHTIEPNRKQLPYNALYQCLEAYFGNNHRLPKPIYREHPEPEQGLRTVPFLSQYPLQLDYMRRRKHVTADYRTFIARRLRRWTQIKRSN
jgi:hypothetical protein